MVRWSERDISMKAFAMVQVREMEGLWRCKKENLRVVKIMKITQIEEFDTMRFYVYTHRYI